MSSQTLYSEVLSELKRYNPHASPSQISAGIITIMEKEILPRVFRDLSLPKFPSWTDITIRKSRARQARKRYRSIRSLERRRTIIQQVEYMRHQLSWDGDSTSTPPHHFLDSCGGISPPESNTPSIEEKIGYLEKIEKIEVGDDPYGTLSLPPKAKYQIVLSKEFQEKMLSDALLEEVFREIEVCTRELIENRNLETNIDVSFRQDIEILSWKKYVITIQFPPLTDFKQRTRIWTILDLTIRKRIAELAERADRNTREYLNGLNKNLFIHIEL